MISDPLLQVSGTADGLVQLWDIAGQRCLRRFASHAGECSGSQLLQPCPLMLAGLGHLAEDFSAGRLRAAGAVKGVAITPDGTACVSCGSDCHVRLWRLPPAPFASGPVMQDEDPATDFQGKFAFRGIDHHWGRSTFATAGAQVGQGLPACSNLPLSSPDCNALCASRFCITLPQQPYKLVMCRDC